MKTGQVAIFTQPQAPMDFREYPVPSAEPNDLLVKMRMANICGSDLHFWRGHGPKIDSGIPQVLGHEMVGTIEELGKNIQTDSMGEPLAEGDRITYSYFKPCNHCWTCSMASRAVQTVIGIGSVCRAINLRIFTGLTANTTT